MSEIFTPRNGDDPSDGRPRLVLDTNTVLALWMFRDPRLDALREWIEAGNCWLYSGEDALEELQWVLAYRQFKLDAEEQTRLQADYCRRLTPSPAVTSPAPSRRIVVIPRCSDADDQKFLEIAYESGANLLITRDKALLKLTRLFESRTGCRIVRPDTLDNELRSY